MNPTTFFGKTLSGSYTIPSGIVMTDVPIINLLAKMIPELGILTTKSIGPKPWQGNKEPIIAKTGPGTYINAVGLANPGYEAFAERLGSLSIPPNKFFLISVFGSTPQELRSITKTLSPFADGFELNISCPHSDKYGQVCGQDPLLVEQLTAASAESEKPVMVKVSPNLDISMQVTAAEKGGASGFTAINTIGPSPYTINTHPVLANNRGGLSGRAIRDAGLRVVKTIRALTNKPIIGCGGITTATDVRAYKAAGANFFGVGSALAGMDSHEIQQYFSALETDIVSITNHSPSFLKENINLNYKPFRIAKNTELAAGTVLLQLDAPYPVKPGQFVFLWLPGIGEKPFSVMDDDPGTFLIQAIGPYSTALSKLHAGDTIHIRGPYGNSPTVKGNTLLVAGGTGIAALYLFAKNNPGTIAFLGARCKDRLAYLDEFRSVCDKVFIATDNGDSGHKGFVTDLLEKELSSLSPTTALNCGPPPMVHKAIALQQEARIKDIFSSIEFLTMCGNGMCGRCTTQKGWRSCVDGTFLRPEQL
ncbi:MAG: dihydroorotate dehydrogenase [Nanoarchaeota archaeon]